MAPSLCASVVDVIYHSPMLKLILLLTAALALQQPASTQAPPAAVLSGKVLDRSGAALPGVTVSLDPAALTVVNGQSNIVSSFVTGVSGTFQLPGIAPGTYTLKFEVPGFLAYTRTRLAITAGQRLEMVVALEVAPIQGDRDLGMPTPPPLPPDPTFDLAPGEVAVGVATSVGKFYIAVDTTHAPITAANFLKYVDATLYNWGGFHRATRADNYTPSVPNRPMMNIIQGGINPARRTEGFPAIPLERTSVTGIKHVTGVVSMARGTGADTATSDFFVLLDDQPSLDFGGLRFDDGQGGAAFGHVLSGLDVVRKIQQQPVDGQNLAAPVSIWRVWRLGSMR